MNNTNNENVNVNNVTNSENITPINNTQQEPISQQQSVTQTTTPSASPQEVAPIEVAPMEATPMDEQIISTYKKKSSNTILYILVILLIIFVLFMDNILEFVNKNIINFEKAGEKETIGYNMSMAFNLLIKEVPDNECTFKTMDPKVATVDETTGEVTAVGQGTTYVKLYNKKND